MPAEPTSDAFRRLIELVGPVSAGNRNEAQRLAATVLTACERYDRSQRGLNSELPPDVLEASRQQVAAALAEFRRINPHGSETSARRWIAARTGLPFDRVRSIRQGKRKRVARSHVPLGV